MDSISKLPDGSYDFIPGPLFDFYSGLLLIILGYLFYLLIRAERRVRGIQKVQLRYVIAGVSIFAAVAISFGLILPLFGYSSIVAFDAQSSLFWIILTTYAILRHRLLDIKFVLTRSITYGILLTLVTLSFVFITFISGQFFGNTTISRNIIAFIIAILIVFGLDPLKNWLSRISDKIFFQAKVDYQQLLREVSEILAFEISRDELIIKIREKLQEGLKVKFSGILLRNQSNGKTQKFEALQDLLHQYPNLSLQNTSPLVHFLREHKHYSIVESLERKIEDADDGERTELETSKAEFDRLEASLVTPIFAQGHLIAILALGPKLSGDSFSNDDINLIEVLSPQIGSAIQKANLFEEVRQFNISLQLKVDQATAQLREKNVSLETLQHINKEITQTLDFEKVVQQIADSVSTELGYQGAILAFLDDDGKTSRARAITHTKLTETALKLLPTHFSEYHSDITDPKTHNLSGKVYQTGQTQITNNFARVVSPPLPKLLAQTIQKVVGH